MGTTAKSSARSSNGNFWFDGAAIYSYSTELARYVTTANGTRYVQRNKQTYSITTSGKHQPAIARANDYGRTIREVCFDSALAYGALTRGQIEYLAQSAAEFRTKATKARRNGEWLLKQAEEALQDALFLGEAHGMLLGDPENFLATIQREREAAATMANLSKFFGEYHRAAGEFFDRPLRAVAEALTGLAWLAGVDMRGWRYRYGNIRTAPTLLRLNGDFVQTSQGAEFPLADGLRALPFICRAIREGRAYDFTPRLDGLLHGRPRLGHFAIDSVSAAGWVRAGCHTVPGFAVEWAAREAGACDAPALEHVAQAVNAIRASSHLAASNE